MGDENLALEYLNWLNYTKFEPGTDYEYINPTYVLLGRLIERISNQSFTEYMKENIFKPANMTRSEYNLEETNACHAYDYELESGDSEESSGDRPKGPHDWYEYDYGEETFFGTRPDGGLFSTPRDFIKWEQTRPKLLREDLLNEAYQPHTKVSGSNWSDYQNRPGTWYGYGWFIEPEKECIYHTGDNGGFKILAARYPKKKGVVLVFAAKVDWDRYKFKTQIEGIFDLIPVKTIKKKVIYILQMQNIENKLKIFSITNFPISKNESFKFPIKTYSIKSGRILQEEETKEIEFISSEDNDGKADKITELTSTINLTENTGATLLEPTNSNDIETKLSENENNLDTEKVKEEIKNGGTNFSEITSDYSIIHYSVNSSTNGCKFYLQSDESIKDSNIKNIILNFINEDNGENITAKCSLSSSNGNNIPCQLSEVIDEGNYVLDPFIYSDNTETITITQTNTSNYLPLECTKINNNRRIYINKSSNGLSTGGIIGIVLGIVGALALLGLFYFSISKSNSKITVSNNGSYMVDSANKII